MACNLIFDAGGCVTDALTGGLGDLAKQVSEALGKVVAWMSTFWVQVDTPPLFTTDGRPSSEVAFLQNHLSFYTLGLGVLGLLVGAGLMIWQSSGQPLREMVVGLMKFALIMGGSTALLQAITTATDGFAKWILEESTDGPDFGENLLMMLALDPALGSLLLIVFGLIAILVSFGQMLLMVFRAALLSVFAGVLNTVAALLTTETGRVWFSRITAWILAFELYKPVAAIIYAASFRMSAADVFGSDGEGGVKFIAGISLQGAAILALPALMRLLAPVVAAAAGGGGGAGSAAAAAVGAAASGAASNGVPFGASRSTSTTTESTSSSSRDESTSTTSATGARHAAPSGTGEAAQPTSGAAEPSTQAVDQGAAGTSSATSAGAVVAESGTTTSAAGGAATAGGAAAAAGPIGAAVAVGAKTIGAGVDAAKGAVDDATDSPSGAGERT